MPLSMVNQAFCDTVVYLYVYDPQASKRWINLGFIGDEGFQGYIHGMTWSRDGTVLAVKSLVRTTKQSGRRTEHGELWTHYYDFKNHKGRFSF